jgi:hypothetical protein
VTGEIPAVVARGYHCRFPSARSMSGSNRPFGTGSVSHFWSSVSLPVCNTNRQWYTSYHCRFGIIGSDVISLSLPSWLWRFKIRQWRGVLNRQWCPSLV